MQRARWPGARVRSGGRFAFAAACADWGYTSGVVRATRLKDRTLRRAKVILTILPYCPVAATLAHILASETSDLIRFGVVAGGDQHRCRSVVYEGPLVLRPEWWIGAGLNRPRAINALDIASIRSLQQQLVTWAQGDAIGAVVLDGAGDRGLCAGGDRCPCVMPYPWAETLRAPELSVGRATPGRPAPRAGRSR